MAGRPAGERTIRFLVDRGRLEPLSDTDLTQAAGTAIERAARRLRTAAAALDGGDVDGAYVAAYDAYRMAAEALLLRQGLRSTGGDGSHVTVEAAVGAQFAEAIPAFAKATLERMRRTRHLAQYFDRAAPPVEPGDAEWAIGISNDAVDATPNLLDTDPPWRCGG